MMFRDHMFIREGLPMNMRIDRYEIHRVFRICGGGELTGSPNVCQRPTVGRGSL